MSKQRDLFGQRCVLTLMPETNIKNMSILQTPPGKSAQARGNNTVMKFPNRLYNRFLLLAVDTIANGQSFLLLAVDPHANGPSRVNNPPKPSLGGFTKPSIPKLAIRSDPHDRHKSRYGFCHVLSCLTMLMQCFCLVTFYINHRQLCQCYVYVTQLLNANVFTTKLS